MYLLLTASRVSLELDSKKKENVFMEFSVGEKPLRPLLGQKNLSQNLIGFRLTFATILDFIKKSLCFSAKPFDVLQKTFDLVGKRVRFVDKKFLFAKKSEFSPNKKDL